MDVGGVRIECAGQRGAGQLRSVVRLAQVRRHDMPQALVPQGEGRLRRRLIGQMTPVAAHPPLEEGRIGALGQQVGVVVACGTV